jgi:hypothetical protein
VASNPGDEVGLIALVWCPAIVLAVFGILGSVYRRFRFLILLAGVPAAFFATILLSFFVIEFPGDGEPVSPGYGIILIPILFSFCASILIYLSVVAVLGAVYLFRRREARGRG